jgi:hypothetical protein
VIMISSLQSVTTYLNHKCFRLRRDQIASGISSIKLLSSAYGHYHSETNDIAQFSLVGTMAGSYHARSVHAIAYHFAYQHL